MIQHSFILKNAFIRLYLTYMENLKIGCVIMASGEAIRFGKNKLVQNLNGKPLVSYILEKCAESSLFSDIVVVTRWNEVAKIASQFNCHTILHKEPLVSDTIRLGTQFFTKNAESKADGIMFCVADQPLVMKETLSSLAKKFKENPLSIVRLSKTDSATHEIRFANPVVFPNCFFTELECLPPNESGRAVIKKHPDKVLRIEAAADFELLDADTIEELENISRIQKSQKKS